MRVAKPLISPLTSVSNQLYPVNFCPMTKFDGGLLGLHEADEAAVDWLTTYGS